MIWQYSSDSNGNYLRTAISGLMNAMNLTTNNNDNITTNAINKTNTTTITQNTVNYPVRFGYINKILDWSSGSAIATSMGVPGFASSHLYNYMAFTFWTYSGGALDAALVWMNPLKYIGGSKFGTTNEQIRANIKKLYNDKGIKLLVSAFGATEKPTTAGIDPFVCATKLANFVLDNNLDGVDIDWEDTEALKAGTG